MNGPDVVDQLAALFEQTHERMKRQAARSVDAALVARNWLFGAYIEEFERGGASRAAVYGKRVTDALAERLKARGLRGCSPANLRRFRQLYVTYRKIRSTLSSESLGVPDLEATALELTHTQVASLLDAFPLSWSHYLELMTLDDLDERQFYEIEAKQSRWSLRELKRQIASSLYQRLALSRDKGEIRRLATEGQVMERAADLIKNPLVLDFLGLEERPHYTEDELEAAIITQLERFLLELGKGFLFEARQKRISFDDDHFRIDLVCYNRLLRCYVLFDLKRDKLTHQDLGQMQMYVNYFDRYVKLPDELPTVGIVLCHRKSDALVELTLPPDANIFATKYQLYLPSKEELKAQLEEITRQLEG